MIRNLTSSTQNYAPPIPVNPPKVDKKTSEWSIQSKAALAATGIFSSLCYLIYDHFSAKELSPKTTPRPTFIQYAFGAGLLAVAVALKRLQKPGTQLAKPPNKILKSLKKSFAQQKKSLPKCIEFLKNKKNELKSGFTDKTLEELANNLPNLQNLLLNNPCSEEEKDFIRELTEYSVYLINKPLKNPFFIEYVFEFLVENDKNSAINVALECVKSAKYEFGKIIQMTVEHPDLMIPFGISCARFANFSSEYHKCKTIAEEIWCLCQDDEELITEYLVGCSKYGNNFCQAKLSDQYCLFDGTSLNLFQRKLVHSCEANLYNRGGNILPGNEDIVLSACVDLCKKDDDTLDFLFPIAGRVINFYSSDKSKFDLYQASDTKIRLNNISFNFFLLTSSYQDMEKWLPIIIDPDLNEVNEGSVSFYQEAINILENLDDGEWQKVAKSLPKYKQDVPVISNLLLGQAT